MTEITILLIGIEPIHKLMSESAASAKLGYRSKYWEGRNRTFKHLLQRQVALPVCVLPITAEVGVEPTISCFRDKRLYLFVYSAKIDITS